MRPSSIRSSTRSIAHAQPTSRSPSSESHTIPNSRSLAQALLDHRLVALLEDVERDQLAGQGDEPQREQRKVAFGHCALRVYARGRAGASRRGRLGSHGRRAASRRL